MRKADRHGSLITEDTEIIEVTVLVTRLIGTDQAE